MKIYIKKLAPYIGIPVLAAALFFMRRNTLSANQLLQLALLLLFGYLATVTDIKSKLVPNRLVLFMFAAWVLVFIPYLFLRIEAALPLLLSSALGFVLSGVIFLLVYLISRKGLGGGDVKLMAVAGLYLGLGRVLPAMLIGSVLAAVAAVILILAKKMDSKGTIPLVPFLYVGILLTIFFR